MVLAIRKKIIRTSARLVRQREGDVLMSFGGILPNTADETVNMWAFIVGITITGVVLAVVFTDIEDRFASKTGLFPALGGKGGN